MYNLLKSVKNQAVRDINGSFTIEASVVLPISLLIIVTLIFMAILAHDNTSADAAALSAIDDKAGMVKVHEVKPSQSINERIDEKVIGMENISFEETIDKDSISIKGSTEYTMPYSSIFLTDGDRVIYKEFEATGLDARKEILKYKVITDGLEEVGVLSKEEKE